VISLAVQTFLSLSSLQAALVVIQALCFLISLLLVATACLASEQAFLAAAFTAGVAVVAAGLHFSVSNSSFARPLDLA